MKLLLDTQILIWSLVAPKKLSEKLSDTVKSTENQVFVSAISLWEIEIKSQIGKLKAPSGIVKAVRDQQFEWLSFESNHVGALSDLPLIHRDPFDRALIAQARWERLTFVSADIEIHRYSAFVELWPY